MSLGDGSGLSAADIMALSNNNDGFGGGAGFGCCQIVTVTNTSDQAILMKNATIEI